MATAAQNQAAAAMSQPSPPTLAGTLDALRRSLPEWWPIYAGLAILFGPTFYDLFTGAWIGEEQGHGPIIFFLALWLIWRKWPEVMAAVGPLPSGSWSGWPVLALGLMFHLLGRSQKILMFEVGSIVVVMAALVLLKFGSRALRVLWFPFFFMLFLVPLPSELVAAVTMPMKMAVSWVTEHILFALGYPISRSGVVLQMGQYQLLVADACAGLQTLLTLEALGLFYLNLMRHPSAFRNIALAILIIPISFTANVIRVIALTLITYYFGDAAGQGFLHGFAGMVLFVTALLLILAVDNGLQWWIKRGEGSGGGTGGPGSGSGRMPGPRTGPLKEAT
ncbi:exosortase B [Massilia sp. BSC265]|uniref:exosortase B n=1 Tax=Massilia sp. BSC265 TaxID=1549812 RepID=UPI000A9208E1|nr:exosortase B [Massilia sp. BSC265]